MQPPKVTLFAIPNTSSNVVTRHEVEEPPEINMPDFGGKKELYRKWCGNPRTEHAFISVVEGLLQGSRVCATNPPRRLHGLIFEYDAPIPAEGPDLSECPHPPAYWIRTFSGRMRLLWAFEEPIPYDDPDLQKNFQRVAQSALKANRLGAGFEAGESSRPEQYFEVGQWAPYGEAPIPTSAVLGWVAEASKKVKWSVKGVQLPIDDVRAECERRWPNAWPGGWEYFELGARGVRFWDPSADALAVVVAETGCVCFTGDTSFMSWSDILGASWVREAKGGAIGEAIEGLWWHPDSNTYFRKKPNEEIEPVKTLHDLNLHLTVKGLSDEKEKGEILTEIQTAIHTVQMYRAVDAVTPWIYLPRGVVTHNGRRHLNNSRVVPIAPDPEPHKWGEGFPFIANYYLEAFGHEQTRYLCAWLAHIYSAAIAGRQVQSLALIVAGPQDSGKTANINAIVGPLLGGHRDASSYLRGKDQFNSTLLDCPIWTVHDGADGGTLRDRGEYSQILKRTVANREVHARAMHREGVDIRWGGAVVITVNDDPQSLRMVPILEIGIVDKLLGLICGKTRFNKSDEEIAKELPHFGAFLRDSGVPTDIAHHRFGLKPYVHPHLLEATRAESETVADEDVIDAWRDQYFKENPTTPEWVGTPTKLLIAMDVSSVADIARRQFRSPTAMGMALARLRSRGTPWIKTTRNSKGREVTITRR